MPFAKRRTELLGRKKELYLSTFFGALLVAAAFFLPYIFMDKGYFLFYGDFNVQQIPFYKLCHEAIRSGEIGWNWNTDLGVNFIGSYTFYTLGSPFFWLTLPFPTDWVPYLMGPLLILKFAASALTAYCLIRRFTRTPESARLGAFLYAFSGFSVYNIFFNHFHEAIIFFPLLLLSVELLITENRRGFFAAMVAITAVSNYFFFYGMVVFVVIYWLVRTLSHCYKIRPARFFWFCFEAILGFLLSAVVMLPTMMTVLANSRIGEIALGWGAVQYGKEQIYLNILQCFFFPPDLPARPIFFPDADVKWSSLGGWLPLFSMVGVFAWLQQKKHSWQRRLLGISIFMALVPILNSAFYLFNNAYYARWYFMPILIMALVTAAAIEDHEIEWKTPYKWVTGITLATVLVIGLFPRTMEDGKITEWGLYTNTDSFYTYRFLATSAIAVVSLVILGLMLRLLKENRRQFIRIATSLVCVISVIYSAYFIGTGKTHSYSSDVMIDDLIEADLSLPDDKETYRIDVYDGVDNTGMYLGYQSINAFHSIVPTSVTEFWEYVGEERGVASRPEPKSYAARSLLGVKYLLSRKDGAAFTDEMGEPQMPDFSLYSHEEGYDVYRNENALPMGFAYSYYMTEEQCSSYEAEQRSNMMLKAVLLNEEQIEKYGHLLTNLSAYQDPAEQYTPSTQENSVTESVGSMVQNRNFGGASAEEVNLTDEQENVEVLEESYPEPMDAAYSFYCDAEELRTDTAALKQMGVTSFAHTKTGFEAEITLEKENLVFFSVPYEDGWSATVNGKPVEVEQVNVGFMAVKGEAGENTIAFTYQTPGLSLGIWISILSLLILVLYCATYGLVHRYRGRGVTEYPEGEQLLDRFAKEQAAEEMMEAAAQEAEMEEESDIVTEAENNNSFYRAAEEQDFKRGFWIKLENEAELTQEESNLPTDESDFSDPNEKKE